MRHRIALIGILALVALLGGACKSSAAGQAAGTSSDTSTSKAARSQAANTPTVPVTATVTVTATPKTVGCTNANITVTSTDPPGGGAAGHEGLVVLFMNHGSAACTLMGYPGVAGLDAGGNQLAQATRTLSGMIGGCNCSTAPVLTLNPGDTVSAVVEGVTAGPGPCTPFAGLLVTPPNTSVSTHITATVPSCDFQTHPVVTGQTGGGPS